MNPSEISFERLLEYYGPLTGIEMEMINGGAHYRLRSSESVPGIWIPRPVARSMLEKACADNYKSVEEQRQKAMKRRMVDAFGPKGGPHY